RTLLNNSSSLSAKKIKYEKKHSTRKRVPREYMKKSILQCRALQKHLFLDKHKANAPKRNFGFILWI
ncbi:hypothetical protein ACT4R9_11800, partial [Ornithobacterium rhinotracheale]|uniref:hypothetical protein n=1 Tax=Ornithobacterium rhinotracheale TaxID=28251 RepID=UPI003FD34831